MIRHVLTRTHATDDGVIGRFLKWATLEEEQQGNQRKISCIPTGLYVCRRRMYVKGGYETFEITGVPGRSDILWHAGNTEEHTDGCVLLGKRLGTLKVEAPEEGGPAVHKLAVLDSKAAHAEFMALFPGVQEWEIDIRNYAA